MTYRYKLADDPRNSGLLYRNINGINFRKDRWLLSEKKLSIAGYEGLIVEEEEGSPIQPPPPTTIVEEPAVEPPVVQVDEPSVTKEESTISFTKRSLIKKLRERGFPEKEYRGLSVEKMAEMLKIDEEISNGRT